MKNVLQKIKNLLKHIKSYFPSRLPLGMTEFDAWAAEVISLCPGLPDNDSTRFAASSMIQYLSADVGLELNLLIIKPKISMACYRSKRYVAQNLMKSASNQVAAQFMNDAKARQAEAIKAAAEAKDATSAEVVKN